MKQDRKIEIWLYVCCFMVFAMALIGAITRLTESGLSIVEWRPLMGALPPLSEAEWQRVYELYQQSPEFAQKHNWMALADFKQIFFWEWLHRLWGRLIGVVYALPLLWFWARHQIPEGFKFKLLILLGLGGFQGLIGWWMVKSGLVDRPDVSHFRLAVHLGMAFLIFAGLLWTALGLRRGHPKITKMGGVCLGLLSLTMVWGAFVAGLDAGKIYNSFPHMNDSFFPDGIFSPEAVINDHGWVQFTHRWLAILTAGFILFFSRRAKAPWLAGMVFVQAGLGIATLLSVVWIPLAVLHQAGAFILLTLLIRSIFIVTAERP